MTTTEAYYTIPQVAEKLQVSEALLYALAKRGDLPVLRIGRLVRVSQSGLDKWLKEREQHGIDRIPS